MSAWGAQPAPWMIRSKLRSFVSMALSQLEAAEAGLSDGAGDDYAELCVWCRGMGRYLKSVGASAPPALKSEISECLRPAWDLRTDQPGNELADGRVPLVRTTLRNLVVEDGPLFDAEGGHGAFSQGDPERPTESKPANIEEMSLQDAMTHLWKLDADVRLPWGDSGFTLDMGRKGKYGRDRAEMPLFASINLEAQLFEQPSTRAFINLLDNYEREVGKSEVSSSAEKQEVSMFLNALCDSTSIKFLLNYIKIHGKDDRCKKLRTMHDLEALLYDLWFAPYRRVRAADSSGFEHVFVGEERDGSVIGLHNWLQFYLEEKRGKVDYLGWVGQQDSDYEDDLNIVTVKFRWDDEDAGDGDEEIKPFCSILVGSSPEFEFAALTLVFLAGNQNESNDFVLGGGSQAVRVTCHPKRMRCGNKIGTAYFEAA